MTTRAPECLSDFCLERKIAGELDPSEESVAAAHIAQCGRCAERESELVAMRDAFEREAPPLPVSKPRPRFLVRSNRWTLAAGGLALAAAVFLFLRSAPDSEGVRIKGGADRLGLYVKHGDAVRAGSAGEHVEPGDALRFVVTLREPRHVAVLSLDGRRSASVYFPAAAEAPRLEAGSEIALPSSIVLDEVLGTETLFGVFCTDAFEVEPLRAALEATGTVAPPRDCQVDAMTIEKTKPWP